MKYFVVSVLVGMMCVSVALASVITVPTDARTIQDGLDIAENGDMVLVLDGVYTGEGNRNIDFHRKTVELVSENGYEHCVIDCEHEARAFYFHSGEYDATKVIGFTIRNGYAEYGGGIQCESSSPAIYKCLIEDCVSYGSDIYEGGGGGGINLYMSDIDLRGCILRNNNGRPGGAVCVAYGSAHIDSCLFEGNYGESGGAVFCYNTGATIVISNTVMSGNRSGEGGAVYSLMSEMELVNCLIEGGSGGFGNGICLRDDSLITCKNSTIMDDVLVSFFFSKFELTNSICWGGLMVDDECEVIATYSDTYDDLPGTGNIHADPLFVTGPEGDFYLSQVSAGQTENSPCVDAGSDEASLVCYDLYAGSVCMDGFTTRTDACPDTGTVDMGFHYSTDGCFTPTPTATPTQVPTATPAAEPVTLTLVMPSDVYAAGDTCFCRLDVRSNTQLLKYPTFVVLEIYGVYYYAPGFTTFDYYRQDYGIGTTSLDVLDPFTWPENAGAGEATFYAAILMPDFSDLFSELAVFPFRWH